MRIGNFVAGGLVSLVLALSSGDAGEPAVKPKIKAEKSQFYKDKLAEAEKYHAENKEFESAKAFEAAVEFENKYGKKPFKKTEELEKLSKQVIKDIMFHYTKIIEAERLLKKGKLKEAKTALAEAVSEKGSLPGGNSTEMYNRVKKELEKIPAERKEPNGVFTFYGNEDIDMWKLLERQGKRIIAYSYQEGSNEKVRKKFYELAAKDKDNIYVVLPFTKELNEKLKDGRYISPLEKHVHKCVGSKAPSLSLFVGDAYLKRIEVRNNQDLVKTIKKYVPEKKKAEAKVVPKYRPTVVQEVF